MVHNTDQGAGSEYKTLIKAFNKDCINFLKLVGKDRSIGTYKVIIKVRNYVAAFITSGYTHSIAGCPLHLQGQGAKKYEFRNKVSIVRLWNGIIIGAKAFSNEYAT